MIAGAIGIGTLAFGGQESDSAQPLPPSPDTVPVAAPSNPPATSSAGAPSPTQAPPPPEPVAPPQQPTQDVPVGSGDGAALVVVRVYNNSTISGLAHRAAEDLKRAGYDVPEIGNYSGGIIPTTTVYFRPGTDEERQARELAARIGARAEPRFDGIRNASPGLIAIITNDYKGTTVGK
ncbi:hypothetical protein GCM10011581_01250 [Saccharopolyspora subtropica]|uniref:LytR/CpsA/Psr regulator C-terminal domain-containing protein n=1 Tax=Saccharopolyspora thermophila TaxID=89367 RepID=A0A917JI10_9PSEU|nr:hypothetical protein GCM10011581_01250 [Saccharopolyspora subtropica]